MWSEENLENLKGSPLLKDIKKTKASLEHDYNIAAEMVPGFASEYSQKEFFEMWLAAESRHFTNQNHSSYAPPIADIFNHDINKGVTMKYQGLDSGNAPGLYIRAIKNISKGEQIFWNYGDKGNYEFLKLYGFILVDGTQPKSFKFFVDLEKLWQAEPSNTPQELEDVKKELYSVWKGKSRVKFNIGEDFDSDTLK